MLSSTNSTISNFINSAILNSTNPAISNFANNLTILNSTNN